MQEVWASAGDPRFVATACMVGILTGCAAIVLERMIHAVQWLALGASELPTLVVPALPWPRVILAPALGGLAVGLIGYLSKEVRGHGVPDVIEAVALRGGRIRKRVAAIKCMTAALSIGSGGSVGREGPIAQIGASVGSAVGQWLRVPADRLRTLTAAGAAGGIAAAFNAPIAGAFFALEVIARNFAAATFGPVVLCAVFATMVSRLYFGEAPAFNVPPARIGSVWHTPLALLLGLACGFAAFAFTRLIGRLEHGFRRLPLPLFLKPALGGLAVGGMIVLAPQLYGVGHETMDAMLSGNLSWQILLLLLLLKPLATSTTLASGGSGGVFLPSLYLGGVVGGLFGSAVSVFVPDAGATPGAWTLIGMAAALGGTAHAPITAVLLAIEITHDYGVILPVMLATAVATLVARALRPDSIYTEVLRARGVDLERREDLVLRGVSVGEVMRLDPPAVRLDAPLDVVMARLLDGGHAIVFVIDAEERLQGQISIHDVTGHLDERMELGVVVVAGDVFESAARATPETSVADALEELGRSNRDMLAVVDDQERLIGSVSLRAITDVIARDALRGEYIGVAAGTAHRGHESLRLTSGLQVRTVRVPHRAAGESVRSLEIRSRWNLSVISVRRGGVDEGVDPDRSLEPGDTLVVMGSAVDVDRFQTELGSR